MKELILMWRNTRMIILVALIAAIYAAILIPFKAIPLIPGVTELRPGNVCPIIFSLMFGPAAAWGSMLGNLVADVFGGTLGLPSLTGIFGNFFMGLIPYIIWGKLGRLSSGERPYMKSRKQVGEYMVVALIGSIGCGAMIGWGLDALRLFPFAVLGNIISLNNLVAAVILGPFLLRILYPRVERWGLLWTDIMKEEDRTVNSFARAWVMIIASLGTFVVGNLLSILVYKSKAFGAGFSQMGDASVVGQIGVVGGLIPLILLYFSVLLMKGESAKKATRNKAHTVKA